MAGGFTALSLLAGGVVAVVVWLCRTRDMQVWRRTLVVGFLGAVSGVALGQFAEMLYRWGDVDYRISVIGAPVGLAIGIAYALLIARLRERTETADDIFAPATLIGGIVGIASSCLIHGYLMIAYQRPKPDYLLTGQIFGLWAGVILGWVTRSLFARQEHTLREQPARPPQEAPSQFGAK